MARKGLNKEKIVDEALAMIQEEGFERFSLHRLAARLGVKTASLYNHIDNIDQIGIALGEHSIRQLRAQMDEATGQITDAPDRLMQIAIAYRDFAHESPELYKIVLNLPALHGKALIRTILDPMQTALKPFIADEQERIAVLRSFRSMIHGFVSLEALGYFENPSASIEYSYKNMISNFIKSIEGNT